MKATLLLLATILLSGCSRTQSSHDAGRCYASEAPAPWRYETRVDAKDYFYGGWPHFSAPLDSLGLATHRTGDFGSAFVALRTCSNRNVGEVSPCDEVQGSLRGERANTAQGIPTLPFANLNIRHFPYFVADDGSFAGECSGIVRIEDLQNERAICRFWLADAHGRRGLLIVVPASALPHAHAIVARASVLLGDRLSGCAQTFD